jgi:hypothetical protein
VKGFVLRARFSFALSIEDRVYFFEIVDDGAIDAQRSEQVATFVLAKQRWTWKDGNGNN